MSNAKTDDLGVTYGAFSEPELVFCAEKDMGDGR